MSHVLREHQLLALRKLSNGKILWGGVGSGKTLVAATYYIEKESPKHVYVITTAKKRDDFDWQQQFYELGIGPRTGPEHAEVRTGKGKRPGSRRAQGPAGQAAPEAIGVGVQLDGPSGDGNASGPTTSADKKAERSHGVGSGLDQLSGLLLEGDRFGQSVAGGESVLGRADTYPYVLTVDSWNNISKYADVHGAFFIFDEQRLVGSGEWTRKFLKIAKNNHWILLSATPGDTWMDYIPVFVANGFYKNRTEFKREHVVYNTFSKFPKVDRYINVGRLMRYRSSLLVEMPFVRHTRRRMVEVMLPYDREKLEEVLKKRWHVFEERPLRDIAEMCSVARRVVNGDPSRLDMVCDLWNQHPKLIVFYNFNYELESLRSLKEYYGISSTGTGTPTMKPIAGSGVTTSIPTSIGGSSEVHTSSLSTWPDASAKSSTGLRTSSRGTAGMTGSGSTTAVSVRIAEWNGHKHQPVPTTDRWLYLVQYTAGAEGWNCIETDAMTMYSRNYSWKVTEQAYGRNDRLNTPFRDLWYYNFTSDSWIDRAIERSLKAKKTFNEAEFAGMFKG